MLEEPSVCTLVFLLACEGWGLVAVFPCRVRVLWAVLLGGGNKYEMQLVFEENPSCLRHACGE